MVEYLNPFTSYKTTEIHITSELATLPHTNLSQTSMILDPSDRAMSIQGYEQYSVTIEKGTRNPMERITEISASRHSIYRQHNAAMEANTAAWAYTKCAILFFFSLLITWVSFFHRFSLSHSSTLDTSILPWAIHHTPSSFPLASQLTIKQRSPPPSTASTASSIPPPSPFPSITAPVWCSL